MTKDEFWKEYQRLNKAFTAEFRIDDVRKMAVLFDMMKPLDRAFWSKLVARIILTNNPKLDIKAAVVGEIRAIKSAQETKIMLNQETVVSDDALEKHLSAIGVSSLVDCLSQNKTDDNK